MPLLQTFPPHSDESGLGYYRRLAAANSLWKWREVASLANVTCYKTSLFESPDFVASQLELEPAWTHFASKQDDASRTLLRMRRQRYDAVCPCCLEETVYLRRHWEHAFITACPKHGCLLMEKCPSCSNWLTPEREHIELCACGHDLRTTESVKASPLHLWLSSLLNGQASMAMQPALKKVDPQALASLIKLLGQYTEPAASNARQNQALPTTLAAALEFLAPLESMFSQWPKNFENHVKARIAAGPKDARTVNRLLGHWLRELRKIAEHPPLKIFLKITLDVCQENFNGRLGTHDHANGPANANFKPVSQAARLIGVTRDTLVNAMIEGKCAYRTMRYGTKGECYEVSLREIARIQSCRGEWISDTAACECLGVSPSILKSMSSASVIKFDAKWRSDISKGGPVQQTSLTKLFNVLKHFSEVQKTDEETVAWSDLTSRRMGDKAAIQSLMQAALKGDIKAVRAGKKVGEFAFLRSDFARYFGTPLLEAGMTLTKLEKLSGWKYESISHWIQQELLEAEQIQLRGQPCSVVLPEQLLRFRQTYMPLADLAKSLGTRSSSLIDKISAKDLVGAKELPNGAQRGALIRISDLSKWALLGLQISRTGDLFRPQDYESE